MSARTGFRGEHRGDSRFETRADQRLDQLRIPPQSIEAEQAVLGGLMLAPESYDIVGDSISEHDFYRRDHQLIFRAIRHTGTYEVVIHLHADIESTVKVIVEGEQA